MHDLIFVGLFAGFAALCLGYTRICDRIVGSGDQPHTQSDREL
jgi:hypothetical protein